MEQRATRTAPDERQDFVADEDPSIELDAEEVLELLDDDIAADLPDDAIKGIVHGVLISVVLWIVALGALVLLL